MKTGLMALLLISMNAFAGPVRPDDQIVEKIRCLEPNADNNYSVIFSGPENWGVSYAQVIHETFAGSQVVANLYCIRPVSNEPAHADELFTTLCQDTNPTVD